jgi:hypothetical protein
LLNQRFEALKWRGFRRRLASFRGLTARLKPCPFKTSGAKMLFRTLRSAAPPETRAMQN